MSFQLVFKTDYSCSDMVAEGLLLQFFLLLSIHHRYCHDIPILLGHSVTSNQKLHRPGVNDKNSLFILRASSFLTSIPLYFIKS